MSKNPESVAQFAIGSSTWLSLVIDSLHALAVSACWLNELPIFFRVTFFILVAASWIFQRKACKANKLYLRYTLANGWAVSFDGTGYLDVKINPTTVVGMMVTILHFDLDNRSKTLVVVKDAMIEDEYRKLIVLLKISG